MKQERDRGRDSQPHPRPRLNSQPSKFAIKIRWQFSYNSPDQNKKFHPKSALHNVGTKTWGLGDSRESCESIRANHATKVSYGESGFLSKDFASSTRFRWKISRLGGWGWKTILNLWIWAGEGCPALEAYKSSVSQ